MKIQVELSNHTLSAINQLWGLPFDSTRQGKINQSVVQFASERFLKKAISRSGKPLNKPFTYSLYNFEGSVIEIYLRAAATIHFHPGTLERTLIDQLCNDINQKLA